MKVIALKLGFYNGSLVEPNTEFDVPSGASAKWFEPVEPAKADTVDEIKARLDELGVEYPSKANKAELEAILASAEK